MPNRLYKKVKRRFSSVPPTACCVQDFQPDHFTKHFHTTPSTNCEGNQSIRGHCSEFGKMGYKTEILNHRHNILRRSSSYESIEDSGYGWSIKTRSKTTSRGSSLSTYSNRSSIGTTDEFNIASPPHSNHQFIGYGIAKTDCTPSPYQSDALQYKRGDVISIISKDQSGTWIGMNKGKKGHFKFINIECESVPKPPDEVSTNNFPKEINQRNEVRLRTPQTIINENILRRIQPKASEIRKQRNSSNRSLSQRLKTSQSYLDLETKERNKYLDLNIKRDALLECLSNQKKVNALYQKSPKCSSFESFNNLMSLLETTKSESNSTELRICSNTLRGALDFKLRSEEIDLTEEPYSDPAGFCGIPPALIQRYADETQRDTYEIAEALDIQRMNELQKKGRRGIPNDYLGDSCLGPVIDEANYENLGLWLISLGLPMYENSLKANGFSDLSKVSKMRETDIVNKCCIGDKRHVRILTNAVGALHLSLDQTE